MTAQQILGHIGDGLKHILDALSYTVILGVAVQLLPPIAAGMSIIWIGMQMFGWVEARRKRRLDEIRQAARESLAELDKAK